MVRSALIETKVRSQSVKNISNIALPLYTVENIKSWHSVANIIDVEGEI
jgi:hypothetical protein